MPSERGFCHCVPAWSFIMEIDEVLFLIRHDVLGKFHSKLKLVEVLAKCDVMPAPLLIQGFLFDLSLYP